MITMRYEESFEMKMHSAEISECEVLKMRNFPISTGCNNQMLNEDTPVSQESSQNNYSQIGRQAQ